jgi:hypothetical protein
MVSQQPHGEAVSFLNGRNTHYTELLLKSHYLHSLFKFCVELANIAVYLFNSLQVLQYQRNRNELKFSTVSSTCCAI